MIYLINACAFREKLEINRSYVNEVVQHIKRVRDITHRAMIVSTWPETCTEPDLYSVVYILWPAGRCSIQKT